jgi:hypothetical protein
MDKKKRPRASIPETRRETYNGHEIVILTDEGNNRLSIDGRTVYYARNARGEYYLDKYAYDPGKIAFPAVPATLTFMSPAMATIPGLLRAAGEILPRAIRDRFSAVS